MRQPKMSRTAKAKTSFDGIVGLGKPAMRLKENQKEGHQRGRGKMGSLSWLRPRRNPIQKPCGLRKTILQG